MCKVIATKCYNYFVSLIFRRFAILSHLVAQFCLLDITTENMDIHLICDMLKVKCALSRIQ